MTSFVPTSPKPDEAFEFYSTYLRLVPNGNLFEMATDQIADLVRLSQSLSEESASVVHSPYQWTIKQVIGHMIDTERIFAGRLHRFAVVISSPARNGSRTLRGKLRLQHAKYRGPHRRTL